MKNSENRLPLPPFSQADAIQKIRMAEDAWNTQNPENVSLAYSIDSQWRNRDQVFKGRNKIVEFLAGKWQKEKEYRLIKELWAHQAHRIAVRFAYEYKDNNGQWFRAYGNENWQFNEQGLMTHRNAIINDLKISDEERLFHWPLGIRPGEHPGLSDLGL